MDKQKGIRTLIQDPHMWIVLAQLYSNAAVNLILKGPAITSFTYTSSVLLGSLYAYEQTRKPFISFLKWTDKIFRGTTEPSERLQKVFNNVVSKLENSQNNYQIFSYQNGRFKTNLGRVFNRNNDIYIGPDIESALNDKELSFVIAHSIGHAKNDDFTIPTLSTTAIYLSFSNISYGLSRILENQMTNTIPSTLEAFSIAAAPVVCATQYFMRNKLFSDINQRADKEALKICPDKDSAISALAKLKNIEQSRKEKILDYLYVHPENYQLRIDTLQIK